jgi:hypothetical protein
MVGRRGQDERLAVEFDLDTCLAHRVAQGIARFIQAQQFESHLGPVGHLDFLRFVHIQVHRADDRCSRRRCIRRVRRNRNEASQSRKHDP